MIKLVTTRYYGYFTIGGSSSEDVVFHILCIAPPCARIRDYIGDKNVKFTDLLCLDDYVLSSLPDLVIDWSKVRKY